MAKEKTREALAGTLGIRVSEEEIERLDALVERLPIGSRHSIARFALRVGLDVLEKDPSVLLGSVAKGRRPSR